MSTRPATMPLVILVTVEEWIVLLTPSLFWLSAPAGTGRCCCGQAQTDWVSSTWSSKNKDISGNGTQRLTDVVRAVIWEQIIICVCSKSQLMGSCPTCLIWLIRYSCFNFSWENNVVWFFTHFSFQKSKVLLFLWKNFKLYKVTTFPGCSRKLKILAT